METKNDLVIADEIRKALHPLSAASGRQALDTAAAKLLEVRRNQRPFTEDEFQRFIDRLVWAIGASPGGKLDDEQRAKLKEDIVNVMNSCARVANPQPIIADRMLEMFEGALSLLENQRFDFETFVRRCRGASA